MVDEGMITIPN